MQRPENSITTYKRQVCIRYVGDSLKQWRTQTYGAENKNGGKKSFKTIKFTAEKEVIFNF